MNNILSNILRVYFCKRKRRTIRNICFQPIKKPCNIIEISGPANIRLLFYFSTMNPWEHLPAATQNHSSANFKSRGSSMPPRTSFDPLAQSAELYIHVYTYDPLGISTRQGVSFPARVVTSTAACTALPLRGRRPRVMGQSTRKNENSAFARSRYCLCKYMRKCRELLYYWEFKNFEIQKTAAKSSLRSPRLS